MEKQINIPVTPQMISPTPDENPVKVILGNIKEKLAETPGLKYIDQDWGQLDDYSPNFPVQWPCALIDVSAANYSNLGHDASSMPRNRQQANAQLTVTVANLKLTNTSYHAPVGQEQEAWVVLDIIQAVHEKLHGTSFHVQAGAMLRQSMQRTKRDDGVQEYRIEYVFAIHNV